MNQPLRIRVRHRAPQTSTQVYSIRTRFQHSSTSSEIGSSESSVANIKRSYSERHRDYDTEQNERGSHVPRCDSGSPFEGLFDRSECDKRAEAIHVPKPEGTQLTNDSWASRRRKLAGEREADQWAYYRAPDTVLRTNEEIRTENHRQRAIARRDGCGNPDNERRPHDAQEENPAGRGNS